MTKMTILINGALIKFRSSIALYPEQMRKMENMKERGSRLDVNGNMPAVVFAEAAIARNIVRDREAVGMSQKQSRKPPASGLKP